MALIDQRDPSFNNLFKNLQGNILKGHGREHTANIFISCDDGVQTLVKRWIKGLVERGLITSTKKQLRDNFLWKDNNIDGGVFGTILFSKLGYEYLGFDANANFNDSEFNNGMKNADLNDPPFSEWEYGFRKDIHFLLLIGDNDKENVKALAESLKTEINQFGEVTTIEYGNALKNADGAGIEHFGYVDGVSQPLFFEDELEKYKNENNVKNNTFLFDPSAEKELVLTPDPFTTESDSFGSYFVFRKLEQNVKEFKKAEQELARDLNLEGEDEERAGAMLVGRFEDGTPVELSEEAKMIRSYAINNFDYTANNNSKCPFHGHIRKTNPRNTLNGSKQRIMARRGIPFGERNDDPNDGNTENKPISGVGLLFMSFQASIDAQFKIIQSFWANEVNFLDNGHGLDPIIGQDRNQNASTGEFAQKWGDMTTLQQETFSSFVTMKGGEYFFAPSIPFLNSL